MPTMEVKLTCGQCGYANEPERVYCHNCGSKLDRSVLPKEEAKRKEESPETARRIVARLKERRALRPSADLPSLSGGAPDGPLA